MFDVTQEQQETWRRKVHAVDAALKSAVEAEPVKSVRQSQGLHFVPKLHLPLLAPNGRTLAV